MDERTSQAWVPGGQSSSSYESSRVRLLVHLVPLSISLRVVLTRVSLVKHYAAVNVVCFGIAFIYLSICYLFLLFQEKPIKPLYFIYTVFIRIINVYIRIMNNTFFIHNRIYSEGKIMHWFVLWLRTWRFLVKARWVQNVSLWIHQV